MGGDAGSAIGHNVFDFIVPEERERALTYTQATMKDGTVHSVEYALCRMDGSRYPAEISAALIPDVAGKPSAFIGIVRDITARKRSAEAITRHNQELLALNAIATTLNQTRELGRFLDLVLPEILKVLGIDTGWIELFQTEQVQDTPVVVTQSGCPHPPPEGLLPPPLHEALLEHIRNHGTHILVEGVHGAPGADLPALVFSVAAFPIKMQTHGIGMLGIAGLMDCRPRPLTPEDVWLLTTISYQIGIAIENIRLLKETVEIAALRELDHLRSELIANFSHDLRTPLGLIKMSYDLVARRRSQRCSDAA